jgi:Tol biopolymer transport system component
VRHPNVVTVHGASRIDGRTGLWMEFVDGETLEEELTRRGPLPAQEVARIGIDLAAALEAVHAAGLLHRDVKAQNVMRERTGRLVLMDFGAGTDADWTGDRSALAGTPAYLAPEQLEGGPPSVATDVYALGVVLFRLATGRFPIEGANLEEVREAHRRGMHPPVSRALQGMPPAVRRAIARAVAPDPSARFVRARELQDALRAALGPRWTRQGAARVAAVAVILVGGSAAWLARRPELEEPTSRGAVQQRLVWAAPEAGSVDMGSASRDGRFVSSYDYETRALILRDLSTATTRTIVPPPSGRETPELSVLSRDGSKVAYGWRTAAGFQLRVASTDGSASGTQVPLGGAHTGLAHVLPLDWSPDGSHLLAGIRRGDALDLALIDVRDGSRRTLMTGYGAERPRAAFSNDGRFVAANISTTSHNLQHDIFLLAIDQSATLPAIVDPGHDVVAGWSPDGSDLVFLSDRGGARALWKLRIVDGRPAGSPVLVRPDVSGFPIGIDESGTLMLAVSIPNRDVYVASVDLETGAALSPVSRPVSRHVGTHRSPSFSPDGRTLAYVSIRAGLDAGGYLVLHSLQDGSTRELRLEVHPFLNLSWTADSRAVIGIGRHSAQGTGVYRVETEGGSTSLLLAQYVEVPQLSSDERKLYFVRREASRSFEFVERDLSSGVERRLLRSPANMSAALAPDASQAAIVFSEAAEMGATRRLVIVPVNGGPARELLRGRDLAFVARWTRDGRKIVLSYNGRVVVVPAGGGAPRPLDLEISPAPQREEHLALHPDDKQLVFMAGEARMELWSFENFLQSRKE